MSEERKRFSRRRADKLWRVVDDAVVQLRMHTLRGGLTGLNSIGQEPVIHKALGDLADKIVAAYKEKMS